MNGNGFSTGNCQIFGGIPNTGAQFVDGGSINNGYINAISYIPSQDSIQEFRVEGSVIGPQFGGTTNGVVTMVTKSGTNAFHGTAFDFLRNTVLNANTFFNNQSHLKGGSLFRTSSVESSAVRSRNLPRVLQFAMRLNF